MKGSWWDDQNHANQKEWPNERVCGWAPGNYTCTCGDCGARYLGDKRSVQCYPCAKASTPPPTPDTCPHCGAQLLRYATEVYSCGTLWMDAIGATDRGVQCARYVRVRISQLRRMAHIAYRASIMCRTERDRARMERFLDACLREIDRLRVGK